MLSSRPPSRAAPACRFPLIAGRHRIGELRYEVIAFAILFYMVGTEQQIQSLGISSDGSGMRALPVATVPLALRAGRIAMLSRLLAYRSKANENFCIRSHRALYGRAAPRSKTAFGRCRPRSHLTQFSRTASQGGNGFFKWRFLDLKGPTTGRQDISELGRGLLADLCRLGCVFAAKR